ncbi:MAG: hypothetical protein HGB08_04535 [Candidatus Moranbacteria bacterium]|nr:hypothetical protein [Candidatus Moranbacteria bacterium]
MTRKPLLSISMLLFIAILLAAGLVFFGRNRTIQLIGTDSNDPSAQADQEKENGNLAEKNEVIPFSVSGWIPYWAKDAGAASLDSGLQLFSEINPFAFGVDGSGRLIDKAGIGKSPWPELFKKARQENVRVVPTILWGDAEAMHKIFSDQALLEKHVETINAMLQKYDFPGADIDYEGKDIADKDGFSSFLQKLHEKLQTENKTLNCTVEARTQDAVPDGFTGIRAMSFANDPKALNDYCDTVRIMAYDQVFQVYRSNKFDIPGGTPEAPNADNRWVEEVAGYFLKYIPAEKLSLGIPTYGWEFQVTKTDNGHHYERVRSVTYPQAIQEAKAASATPVRTEGGELSFTYRTADGEHVVTFEDADSISGKIDIAKKIGLGGISIFKIDGETDPEMFKILGK